MIDKIVIERGIVAEQCGQSIIEFMPTIKEMKMFKKLLGFFGQHQSNNFIGFNKYRKHGAYHWREVQSNSEYRKLMHSFSQYLTLEDTILDIGCGDGAYLGTCASRFKEGWGIDAEAVAIQLAKEKFAEHGVHNCYVHKMHIDEAKQFFANNGQSFSLIWSADVIEHLPRPAELLELATQVLRHDGRVLIGTPLYISDKLISPYHVKEYTKPEIREIINPFFYIDHELIIPQTRKDGRIYEDSYYLAICRRYRGT